MTSSRSAGVLAAVALLAGCDARHRTASTPTPATAADPDPARPPTAPKPDLTRLRYDPAARTLTLYPLPDAGGRWLLRTADAPAGVPVDREVTFAGGADPDLGAVAVFYTLPNRRPSPPVTLREIVEAHSSRVMR